MRQLLLLLIAALAGVLAHLCQRRVDSQRFDAAAATEILYLPSGPSLRVGAMGYHEPLADLMWLRAVLLFGDRHGRDPDPAWGHWLAGMIDAINVLDPSWRTPYHYGGMMLRVCGNVDASDRVFTAAMEAMPDDHFFPFAIGMNHYLVRDDAQEAVKWIQRAAEIPGSPSWYRVAAAGIMARKDMRAMAIRFLEEQRDSTTDEGLRAVLQLKLSKLFHEEYAEQLAELQQRFRQARGRDLASLQELVQAGVRLPPDPLGGEWILAPDGVIRSTVQEEEEAQRARDAERSFLRR